MTTHRDAIGLSDRLRDVEAAERRVAGDCDCRPEDTANWQYADTCREAAAALDALQGEISQWANEVARYKAYAEKFDEENAALQARVKELEVSNRTAKKWQQWAEDERAKYESRATSAEQERDEAYERAAKVAESAYGGKAHTYASENADVYRAQDEACAHIAAAIRRLAAGTEKEKTE